MGKISWDSYNECFKCCDNSCVVNLDENYKTFLNQHHKIMTVDKVKILIYVELRLRELSKHFALEAVRINNDKVSKVRSLLNKIYSQDEKIGNISTNSLKQFHKRSLKINNKIFKTRKNLSKVKFQFFKNSLRKNLKFP